MEKTINCADCGNAFEYTVPTKYPDKRKYCDTCGFKRKKAWDAGFREPGETITDSSTFETPGYPKDIEAENLEYEIRSREVRCRALASALEFSKGMDTDSNSIIGCAKRFEKYILTGE